MWNEALIPSFSSSSSSVGVDDCKIEMFSFTNGFIDNCDNFRLQHNSQLPPLAWSPTESLINISASRSKPMLEKRMRDPSGDDQDEVASREPKKQKPVKKQVRSQKLGDQITALQQLVSPFGKTDTASVLQEAAIHIKNLHEEIQMLLMAPHVGIKQQSGGEKLDLHQRGLCLVPVSDYSSIDALMAMAKWRIDL